MLRAFCKTEELEYPEVDAVGAKRATIYPEESELIKEKLIVYCNAFEFLPEPKKLNT